MSKKLKDRTASQQFVVSIATRERSPPAHMLGIAEFPVIWTCGVSDTSLARNIQLSRAITEGKKLVENLQSIVLLDDDMQVSGKQIERLANACVSRSPVTALYCPRGQPDMYAFTAYYDCMTAGLGACAIALSDLEQLRDVSPSFSILALKGKEEVHEFTTSQSKGGVWLSEDHRLWSRLFHELQPPAALQAQYVKVGHCDKDGHIWWPNDEAAGTVTEAATISA